MNANAKQFQKMTETPVRRLILSLAVPTVISMLVTAIYNMADTYFVSQLNTSASGAVGVVFSLMAMNQAVSFMIGMGSGSTISKLLGQRKNDEADVVAATGFSTAIVFGCVLMVAGLLFLEPLMRLLGATPTILPYAKDYARYILLAAPVMAGSFVLNNILRAEGKAKFAMIGISTGGVLNIVLDPIFISGFDLGISGAAIATAISQTISFVILLYCFLSGKSILHLRLRNISRGIQTYWAIIRIGLPSFCRQGLASASTVLLNRAAEPYGDPAISAMSIVGKVFFLLFSVGLGIGQGYQPVVGYNYGAKKYGRVRQAFLFTFVADLVVMSGVALAIFLLAEPIMVAFIDDTEVIRIGIRALKAQCIAMPFVSLGVVSNMTFQSIGKSLIASILSCARQGLFFIPLIFALPAVWGLTGVEITQPVSDALTFMLCIPFDLYFFRMLKKEENERISD
ncbi:MAG: MATE family efflux transporter [Clostridia bacterium]|nr:MATE family efflux transporter [Clostridia bacterium]